jgi:hypothetical protein
MDCSTTCNIKARPPFSRLFPIPTTTTILRLYFNIPLGLGPVSGRFPRCLHNTMLVIPLSCIYVRNVSTYHLHHRLNLQLRIMLRKWRELCRISARVFNVFVTWHVYSEPRACPIPEVRSAQATYVH